MNATPDVYKADYNEDEEDYNEIADTIFDGIYSEVDVHIPKK